MPFQNCYSHYIFLFSIFLSHKVNVTEIAVEVKNTHTHTSQEVLETWEGPAGSPCLKPRGMSAPLLYILCTFTQIRFNLDK